ncbi:hypothetical protein RB195_010099 [Necator americanus]|uniref:Uncharacterized protein n=1 Tax=Necator americanus TaxID=51031 RepID=A0ABR1CWF2_NECAM
MASNTTDDMFTKKRKAEERKLIEEIRYKRSCIRLAATFPAEEEIQRKIRNFLKVIVMLTRSNNLSDMFTKTRGKRPQHFARVEATLYKCRLQQVHQAANITMERIGAAAQGLSLTYDLYGLLVMADNNLANSRYEFFNDTEEGVTLEPSFTADFIGREVEFIKEFRSQVETEIREAELQEQRENHINAFVQTKEEIEHLHCEFKQYYTEIKGHARSLNENVHSIKEELRRDFKQGFAEIDKRITNQNENTHSIKEKFPLNSKHYPPKKKKKIKQSENINSMRENLHREFGQCRKEIEEQIRDQSDSIKGIIELTKNSLETQLATLPSYAPKTDQEPTMPKEMASERTTTKNWTEDPTSKHQESVGQRNVREEEVEEDLLDLYDDYECTEQKDTSEGASTYTRESIRQRKEHAEKERSEQLDERKARIEEFLRYNREVPERKIRRLNYMRSEERFLTCSFCLARGEHYSDSCPEYATVDTRSRRARCVLCLDSRHDTEHCWSKGKACMYCGSTHHNKALCALPETINKRRKELEKVREELQTLKNHQNRQPGPSNSQPWGECHKRDHR